MAKQETITWNDAKQLQPAAHERVILRGWSEAKRGYIWAYGYYEVAPAMRRWTDSSHETLWFEPIEWASLPTPPTE